MLRWGDRINQYHVMLNIRPLTHSKIMAIIYLCYRQIIFISLILLGQGPAINKKKKSWQ